MQFPILSGIYTDSTPQFRTAYPVNLVPVPTVTGISKGYLRPADGIVFQGGGIGAGRGGIEWNGTLYRVLGAGLRSVSEAGSPTNIGNVGDDGKPVTLDYSFSYLGIASAGGLYLYDGTTLAQVTDTDLGVVKDMIWIDGYFMVTDGETIAVTELNDPFSVSPLKYGSSEVDPDPIVALLKLRNEAYVVNRHTIEVFSNVGGSSFPFARVDGGQITRGAIGTHMCTVLDDAIAFVGGGRNEQNAVWLGAGGQSVKISPAEIDRRLAEYTEDQLAAATMEAVSSEGHDTLMIHLPNETLCYDKAASAALQQPVWYILQSGLPGGQYRARYYVWAYNRWNVTDPSQNFYGYTTRDVGTHWGDETRWQFSTPIAYNEGKGAILHDIELVALTGSVAQGADPRIWMEYTEDGQTWSMQRSIQAGQAGARNQPLKWMKNGIMRDWRALRFTGNTDAHISPARVDVAMEPLQW